MTSVKLYTIVIIIIWYICRFGFRFFIHVRPRTCVFYWLRWCNSEAKLYTLIFIYIRCMQFSVSFLLHVLFLLLISLYLLLLVALVIALWTALKILMRKLQSCKMQHTSLRLSDVYSRYAIIMCWSRMKLEKKEILRLCMGCERCSFSTLYITK